MHKQRHGPNWHRTDRHDNRKHTYRRAVEPQHGVALRQPEPGEEERADQVEYGLEGGVHQRHEEERIGLAQGRRQVHLWPLLSPARIDMVASLSACRSQRTGSAFEGSHPSMHLIELLHVVPMQNGVAPQASASQEEGAWYDEGKDCDDSLQ